MKSLMLLWQWVAQECATRCCTSTTMDLKTVQGRVKHEGLSFLTITLPAFGKDFEQALDQGAVDRSHFLGFSRSGGLPRFLGGFLGLVFDRNTGVLLDEPDIESIIAIRQLTLMFSKILVPCSKRRTRKAMLEYIECEQDVKRHSSSLKDSDLETFVRVSQALFGEMFESLDHKVLEGSLIPNHGPGATADRLRGNAKWRQSTWTQRLDEYFPHWDYLVPNGTYHKELESINILEPDAELPVRVITVPKTLKTPRIIAIEPTAMQYAQQSLKDAIYEHVSGDRNLRKLIGFEDQTPNQRLARQGSVTGRLATLDLSEASDRVSNRLVQAMLSNYPWLRGAVDACRTTRADVDGQVLHLSKFASMGSALTFPIEAAVFLTCCFIGFEKALNTPVDREMINSFLGRVRVYGDDIVVPVKYVRPVVESLSLYGAKVNSRKSFWTGRFRESCGKEYYCGFDVSYVKVRRMFPTQRGHAQELISLVEFRNLMYKSGYWSTCAKLDDYIRGILRYYPVVEPTSPVLGRHSFLGHDVEKIGRNLHNPLVKGWRVSSVPPPDLLEDHGALLKFFTKRGDMPSHDAKHLERAGRPRAVNIKLGYASAV